MTPGKGILKSLSYVTVDYIKERFTKEKISSFGGLIVFILCAFGYISNEQAQSIDAALTVFGYDLNLIGGAAGLLSILTPISKLKR